MARTQTYLLIILFMISAVSSQGTLDNNECLANGAKFNETSGRCECEAGLDGAGDLCCSIKSDSDVCYFAGDPMMRSVGYQWAPINMPCSICIAVIEAKTQDNRACMWEVLSSSTIEKEGAMYLSTIKMGISINKRLPKYITFDGNTVTNSVNGQSQTPSDLGTSGNNEVEIEGEKFVVNYDSTAGFWTVSGCGSKVTFRPHKDGIPGKPGVCVETPKGSINKPVTDGNLCHLQASFDDSIPWAYRLLSTSLNIRQSFSLEQAESNPGYDEICKNDIDPLMQTYCQGISEIAAQKCGPILYNSVIRACFDVAGVRGPDLLKLFGLCLNSFCTGDAGKCNDLKADTSVQKCLPSFTKCETWPRYFGNV